MRASMAGVMAAALASGCFTVTYTNPRLPPNGLVIAGTNQFFVAAIVGDERVPVYKMCPQGVSQIESGLSFVDLLLSVVTFAIYTPRSYAVHCGGAPMPPMNPMMNPAMGPPPMGPPPMAPPTAGAR
ncbi:MAG TPA: hypothetical protein VFQ65_33165 [Kofleriaceae bacterium]|nr:hypothetical protein [Kofleriaceae bacterium]